MYIETLFPIVLEEFLFNRDGIFLHNVIIYWRLCSFSFSKFHGFVFALKKWEEFMFRLSTFAEEAKERPFFGRRVDPAEFLTIKIPKE